MAFSCRPHVKTNANVTRRHRPPTSSCASLFRSIFDVDTIDLGPERRAYLEHKLERVWEINSQGSIPYVPYLRAPYYIWIGQNHQTGRE